MLNLNQYPHRRWQSTWVVDKMELTFEKVAMQEAATKLMFQLIDHFAKVESTTYGSVVKIDCIVLHQQELNDMLLAAYISGKGASQS